MSFAEKVFNNFIDEEKVVLTTFSGNYSIQNIKSEVERYKSLLGPYNLRGRRVGLLVPSIPSYLALLFAVHDLGGTVIPISWQYRKDDLSAILQFLDPHVVFSVQSHNGFHFADIIAEWAASQGKETLLFTSEDCMQWECKFYDGHCKVLEQETIDLICCTSGSTGIPKGLVISFDTFETSISVIQALAELKASDSLFCNAPPSSVFGLACLLAGLHTGTHVVFPDIFELPKMAKLMNETSCNKVMSTPSVFKAIYTFAKQLNPNIVRNIELCCLTGEMMREGFADQFEFMDSCKFVGSYGSSEIGGAMYCDLRQQVAFSVIPGIDYKVLDGELFLKSSAAFSCYYQNPELTREAFDQEGWFRTGDAVRMNDDNKIEIVGRIKDMIKKGGQQVIPGEIEKLLSLHDKVKQAVVVGAPHAVYGEQIVAFVVPDGELDVQQLFPFCADRIAGYKVPDQMVTISEIPIAQGKIDKVTLRKMIP